ncbi:hypothetical protein R3P38DRAFT_3322377 [Favolaschia claudopus]|uniref:CxC2-like cysteine cluster KDZ transposase-associated domain-containing protein n=1 Tax=Favolaschia claudopus TaxID=2862362 RepID=A0AAW0AKU1_9AGAR
MDKRSRKRKYHGAFEYDPLPPVNAAASSSNSAPSIPLPVHSASGSSSPPRRYATNRRAVPSGTGFGWEANDTPLASTTPFVSVSTSGSDPTLQELDSADDPAPEPTAPPTTSQKFGPLEDKTRRPQGASVAIAEVLPLFPAIQAAVLNTFSHCRLGSDCGCGANAEDTVFRCVDCFNAPLWCRQCIVSQHRYTPFHHIEKWNGKFFARDSLAAPAATESCPSSPSSDCRHITREFTILDYNGIHTREVQFCGCVQEDFAEWQQLLGVRLFPATFKHPQTAFTFTVMKQFHIHSLASKKSAYDYIKALCMFTDNAGHHNVTDRYREFLFAFRLWRFCTLQRRSGQAHGIDFWVPFRRAGSLTIRCPACPEVGFNISRETMDAALASERHKFTLYLSIDGKFKLQLKNKRGDPHDFALNDGKGYFVDVEDYKDYLKVAKPEDELGTCWHLRAARMQNIAKFKNAIVSGVIAVQCAHHGFYMTQGMVDLSKGEAFANADYALIFALAEAALLRWIRGIYDIWCHYGIHLLDRVKDLFPSMLSIIEKITGAIPKMHILNHIERCQMQWNLNWIPYSAFTVGEMIETGWAVHNLTAGSTKEMNPGHRHDAIDETSHHWNFEKMISLAATLLRLYRLAVSERRKRTLNFEAVDRQMRQQYPENVPKWEAMDVTPKVVKGELHSVFQVSFKKGPPTHAAAYEKLLKAEVAAEQQRKAEMSAADMAEAGNTGSATATETRDLGSGQSVKGDLGLVAAGLQLERDREHIQRLSKMSAPADVMRAARSRFFQDITALRSKQVQRVPDFSRRMTEVDPDKPEDCPLFLPSQFGPAQRATMKIEDLGKLEYSLREGLAYDAIMELRRAIRTRNWNRDLKHGAIHGVGRTTRAGNYLKTLSNDIELASDTYRRVRVGLVRLGLPNDDETLRPLDHRKKADGKDGKKLELGDARKEEPWFWKVIQPSGMTSGEKAEWDMEMDRVKWFRDRALRDRAVEEQETLEAEVERTIASFRRYCDIWEEIASSKQDAGVSGGAVAYAHKQAAMYDRLRVDCEREWARAPSLIAQDEKDEEEKAKKEED